MRKIIMPGLLALALTGASAIAIAQTQTETPTPPATETPQAQTETGKAQQAQGMPTGQQITTAQAQEWVGKRVYSSTDQNIGDISAFKASGDGNVEHFVADVGGFLGIGATSVQVKPDQLEMRGDRLYIGMTKDEAMQLPKAEDEAQGGTQQTQ